MRSSLPRALLRLAATEMKLFVREPVVVTFVFAFPVLTVLVLGGVFDDDDPGFEGVIPSDYYVAAYIGVVIAAIGLVMLPVHLASYRERGVLRRFDVSRYPRWALPVAWIAVAMVITVIAVAALLVTGHLVYGLPTPDDLLGVLAGSLLGAFTFISIGIALGLALPSARSAQGLGLLLFFPFFLLGGAGPPPEAMGEPMSSISQVVPLTHVVRAIQEPWLDLGNPTGHLAVLAALAAVATAAWLTLGTRAEGSHHPTRRLRRSWRAA
jgi:ABC-2 type transport system permease protein